MDPNAAFAAAKRSCFNEILKPAGFLKGKGIFVRPSDAPSGRLINGINIQVHRDRYTINIGIHFDGVPGCVDFVEKPLNKFELLDFTLQVRPFQLRPNLPQWIPLDDDAEAVQSQLATNLGHTLEVLAEFTACRPDAQSFFTAVPPKVFLEEVPNPTPTTAEPEDQTMPALYAALPDWYPDGFQLAVALCLVAAQEGRSELAAEYAAVALIQESHAPDRAAFRKLWKWKRIA
jgi:hypothetical protein